MKIIGSDIQPIIEVHCDCCRQDHTLTFYSHRKDKQTLELEFKDHNNFVLSDRIRNSLKLLNNLEDKVLNGILLSNIQCKELFSELNKLLDDEGFKAISDDDFQTDKDDLRFYKISDGLRFYVELHREKVFQSELNYTRPYYENKYYRREVAKNHILYKSNDYITDYGLYLEPSELKKLLSVLYYVKERS